MTKNKNIYILFITVFTISSLLLNVSGVLSGSDENSKMKSILGGANAGPCTQCESEEYTCSGSPAGGDDCKNVRGLPFVCASSNCAGGDAGAPTAKDASCSENQNPDSECKTTVRNILANNCRKMCRPNISSICACSREDGGVGASTIPNVKICL